MIASQISFFLKISGPSYVVDTACSSSLTALEHAYRAMKEGLCDSAIVGGTNLCLHPYVSLQFARLGKHAILLKAPLYNLNPSKNKEILRDLRRSLFLGDLHRSLLWGDLLRYCEIYIHFTRLSELSEDLFIFQKIYL